MSTVPVDRPAATEGALREATRIGKNFSFRMVAQILSALINVGAMVLLGNYLNAEGYGDYVFYYALIPLIGSISDFGAGVMITKAIARERMMGPRYYGDGLVIKGAVSLLVLTAVSAFAWLRLDPPHALLVTLVAATAILDFSQDVSVWIVRAHERLDIEALLLLVSQIAWVGGIALGVVLKLSLPWLLAAATVAFAIRALIGVAIVQRRFYRPVFEPEFTRLRGFVADALPFGIAMFGVVLYGRINVLMLKAMASKTDVALFNVGYMLSQPLGFLSTALSMAAFPTLARRAQRGEQAIRHALRRTSKYQLLVTLPLTVGLYLLAERLIPILFHGGDFSKAGMALKLMSLGLAAIFINLMSRYVLAAIDEQRVYLRSIVVGLVVNLGLGLLLIHRYGFAGACVAQLGGELSILITCQLVLTRYVPVRELAAMALRPAAAAACMVPVILALRHANLVLIVTAATVTYAVLLFVFRAFTPEELELLRGIVASFGTQGGAAARRDGPPRGA